jgi:hypothetical protein
MTETSGAPEAPTGPTGGAQPPAPPSPPAPPAARPDRYPITYEADYAAERDRVTTFFRLLLAIPWVIVAIVYAIGSLFVTIVAWFALLILGRYPEALFNYNLGFLRYTTRVASWVGLQTDQWPSFGFGEDPDYPVRLFLDRPERQSRLKVLFRVLLAIPALFMSMIIGYIQGGAAIVSWFSIVFRGYQPRKAHDAFSYAYTYLARVHAYVGTPTYYVPIGGLLTDEYPPLGEEGWERSKG